MNKKHTTFMLMLVISMMAFTSFAQNQDDVEKKWSRVLFDNTNIFNTISDYKYVPGEPRYQRYDFGDIDAVVMPNHTILPGTNKTQSEVTIDIHPLNPLILFAGANATPNPVSGIYGTGVYWSTNAGTNWVGFDNPPFGANNGDPSAAIGTNGYFYMGYITLSGGMGVAKSTNNGANWTSSVASSNSQDDKNHLTVDKTVGSPYENRVYNTWTDFNNSNAVLKFSSDFGVTWSAVKNLGASLNPGSHDQGVNVQTGPNGEAYVTWAIYDAWPGGEDAIAFAKSTDGGNTWTSARVYGALTPNGSFNFGIRGNLKPTSIRVSSFPSMAVDRSGGADDGNIYIVWPQKGVAPAGSDPDIVLIRSTDDGTTWSSPIRVNDDALNNGKEQYYPWCTVDQSSGQLNIVWYDNRNTTSDSTGVFMAKSNDGGLTYENFQVSDANFRPKPISGLASGYQGDYIGITALNNKAYPFWADDRTGNYLAWVAEVTFGPSIDHTQLLNTENLAGPYVINASVTSVNPLVPGSIKLFWGRGAGVISDSVVMTNTSGSNYTANIPGNGLPSVYNYYIYAADNTGAIGTLPGGAPTNYFSFEAATDIVPPVITHTPLGNQAKIRWPATVTADATDNLGVDSVRCEYRVNNGALTGSFNMALTGGNTYEGVFSIDTNLIAIGDSVEYRIRAKDNSNGGNISYNPASGYHKFYIIDVKGVVLVVDADVTLDARMSNDKPGPVDVETPLGASATLFANTLLASGYAVDEVTFTSLNTATLDNYDILVLSGGVATTNMFDDATKRTAIVNYTLAGGKTLVEGGEVGYIFRQQTSEVDVNFRRTLLLDSTWISDVASGSILVRVPTNPMFNDPNTIPGTIPVTNSSGSGYGARDAVNILPNVSGVKKLAGWSAYPDSAGILIYYVNNDTTKPRNIFFTFAVGQITDQGVAADLIENAIWILSPSNPVTPVELVSFNANTSGNNVNLSWTTATEINNSGFAIERKSEGTMFERVGFVGGKGTTTQISVYSYTDSKLAEGNYTYRLKQIDFDGTTSYSNEVNVDVNSPKVFSLDQNYPNPFNPSTVIKYSIPVDGFVTLAVYNLLGEKVASLVNDNLKAGGHEVSFDASNLSSGVYFYRLESGSFTSVKKLMLLK